MMHEQMGAQKVRAHLRLYPSVRRRRPFLTAFAQRIRDGDQLSVNGGMMTLCGLPAFRRRSAKYSMRKTLTKIGGVSGDHSRSTSHRNPLFRHLKKLPARKKEVVRENSAAKAEAVFVFRTKVVDEHALSDVSCITLLWLPRYG